MIFYSLLTNNPLYCLLYISKTLLFNYLNMMCYSIELSITNASYPLQTIY
jgi:hypothetical protein